MKTTAVFFPFDLFGSTGTAAGARLLADAFAEMLADNRREKLPTRAASYQPHVRMRELDFEKMSDYADWRERGRKAARQAWRDDGFLLWIGGNHLSVLPLYDELAEHAAATLVIQFDAHLDVYNLSDCTSELSHGNWLLHCHGPLPRLINLGHRELLLPPQWVEKYYHAAFPASVLAVQPQQALQKIRQASKHARRVFLDIDCDCLDPGFFPAVANPQPFGISPPLLLRLLEAAWSEKVCGVALSEFDPARDRNDQALATLIWLLEYLLLKHYEGR